MNRSVRQWMLSFLAVDIVAVLGVCLSCIVVPDGCFEVYTFFPALFYAPFTWWIVLTGVTINTLGGVAFVSLIGTLFHLAIGAVIGQLVSTRRVSWFLSLPAAFLIVSLFPVFSIQIAIALGWVK